MKCVLLVLSLLVAPSIAVKISCDVCHKFVKSFHKVLLNDEQIAYMYES